MKARALLAFVLFAALAGCGQKDKATNTNPPADGKNKPGTPGKLDETGADLAAAAADVTMSAADWHAEFKKDANAAKAKYKDKVIELTGRAASVLQNPDAGVAFVHLKVEKDILGVRGSNKDLNLWEKVSEGADVTIRGRVPEFQILTGELYPIHIVSVKNLAPTMTTAELLADYAKDKEKFKAKWDDKWVYLEGEFVRAGKSKNDYEEIVLKGAGKQDIHCTIPADAKKQAAKLKPGQKVKVLGQMSIFEEPTLQQALFRGL
ncbi:MAG: hypothetical protein FJ304_27130 [Planctomycetes bacterium]|nr:hypothetical protein [Planctomycetota bacterium]